MSDLATSDIVGEWGPPAAVLCPKSRPVPAPCDCGFVGEWERRSVFTWHTEPGCRRTDRTIRRDLARGFPSRTDDEGWWVITGQDERCPGCGDIERFDNDHHEVARFSEQAKVVVFMDAFR